VANRRKIARALAVTRAHFGISEDVVSAWIDSHCYQYANRLAHLCFFERLGVPARLLHRRHDAPQHQRRAFDGQRRADAEAMSLDAVRIEFQCRTPRRSKQRVREVAALSRREHVEQDQHGVDPGSSSGCRDQRGISAPREPRRNFLAPDSIAAQSPSAPEDASGIAVELVEQRDDVGRWRERAAMSSDAIVGPYR
jgi:hypothetical protein